mmetsp:Transcript_99880/g.156151  ORF Transcript_99880/g.156151 Transcript_99880/m.156151 type:complete len:411 (+) Transcript_99880:57-1289(+)
MFREASPFLASLTVPASGEEACRSSQGIKRRRPSLGLPCGPKRRATGAATPQTRRVSEDYPVVAAIESPSFLVLADGPYFVVASWLDARDLAHIDATCRLLRTLNGHPHGPWQSTGDAAFYGMELDVGGGFFPFEGEKSLKARGDIGRQNWKDRYKLFHTEAPTFSAPFNGREITTVEHPDEVAYCRCRLRTDLLSARSGRGIYVEVEIRANADNLSLAVVDFEGGGRSSVTFSPETGAVLRERKVRESPRAIEGTYIHLLPAAPPGHRFEGAMGLYLCNGHLAFFRRWYAHPAASAMIAAEDGAAGDGADRGAPLVPVAPPDARPAMQSSAAHALEEPSWETTGFCTDLRWAQGQRLSLCLAFRDDGQYNVRIAKVGRSPPVPPHRSEAAYQDEKWNHLYGDDDHPLAI